MKQDRIENLVLEGARLLFRNFSGNKGVYNNEGDRNFCVVIPPESVEEVRSLGWNVKFLKPRDEDEEPTAYLKVNVRYNNYPPKIWVIPGGRRKKPLVEETVGALDFMSIESADVVISPYQWEKNGERGVSAYCRTLAALVRTDPVEEKYSEYEEAGGPIEEDWEEA